jgi:hypothetical protein
VAQCDSVVRHGYSIASVKCGTYIDGWIRCRQTDSSQCRTSENAVEACVQTIVNAALTDAGLETGTKAESSGASLPAASR